MRFAISFDLNLTARTMFYLVFGVLVLATLEIPDNLLEQVRFLSLYQNCKLFR